MVENGEDMRGGEVRETIGFECGEGFARFHCLLNGGRAKAATGVGNIEEKKRVTRQSHVLKLRGNRQVRIAWEWTGKEGMRDERNLKDIVRKRDLTETKSQQSETYVPNDFADTTRRDLFTSTET